MFVNIDVELIKSDFISGMFRLGHTQSDLITLRDHFKGICNVDYDVLEDAYSVFNSIIVKFFFDNIIDLDLI